jgi:DNA modification methylase
MPEARIILGDCLDTLRAMEAGSVDAVVTDPPYGINTKSDGNGKTSGWPFRPVYRWSVSSVRHVD